MRSVQPLAVAAAGRRLVLDNEAHVTPSWIKKTLDEYIVGQDLAKKAIAVAVRNRYRRLLLPPELQKDARPHNVLMLGPTGVGKTEIVRPHLHGGALTRRVF